MTKQKLSTMLIPLILCIPYAFLAMYGDTEFGMEWGYLPALCCPIVLGWYCGKQESAPLAAAGNLISCVLSMLLAYLFLMKKNYYFKPFGAVGMVGFLSALTLAVQLLIWKKQRGKKEAPMIVQFFEVLAMLLIPAVIFVFAMLLLVKIW